MEFINNIKCITKSVLTLKILGFGQTGVPVRFWPGAPTLIKSSTYLVNLKRNNKIEITENSTNSGVTDTTVTPLEVFRG